MTQTGSSKIPGQRKASPSAGKLDCATAFQQIARDCVAKLQAHHSSACAGDAEAVHQIRVAITRLRAAVSFFASITVDAQWLRLRTELRWLNASLGAARDSDVVMAYARRNRYRAWTQRREIKNLHAYQTRNHRQMARHLRSRRFQRLVEALPGWIENGPWHARWEVRRKSAKPLKAYCERELHRWHRRLIRKGGRLETLGASGRHRLRIKAKRFRYMLEALADIVPLCDRGGFRYLHRPAKRLQRVLGDLRDLKRFAGVTASADPGRRPPGYRRHRKKLFGAAIEAYRELKRAGAR